MRLLRPLLIASLFSCKPDAQRNIAPLPDASASSLPLVASSVPDASVDAPPIREFVPAKDISNDDAYLWKEGSGYHVTLLFDQHGRSQNKGRPNVIVDKNEPTWDFSIQEQIKFGESYFSGLNPCRTTSGDVVLNGHRDYLALTRAGAYFGDNSAPPCQKELTLQRFYDEGRDFHEKSPPTFRNVQTDIKTEVGIVRITYQGMFCDDTGRHFVEIRGAHGRIVLRDTLTVELFEEDLDGNGVKELYMLSEQACSGWLRVFRVEGVK
jgi:hypothetical protein